MYPKKDKKKVVKGKQISKKKKEKLAKAATKMFGGRA